MIASEPMARRIHVSQDNYSQSVRNVMKVIENGATTMKAIAEAFAALDDEELEQLGALLRAHHGDRIGPANSR